MKMHNVFISYSTRETGKAEAVRNILEKNGIVCWMAPRDIPAGSNYTEEIPAAIRGCQVFLLILSQNAQKSTWVPRELETAVNCGKVVIPFMVEDFQLNDEFNFLIGAQQRYAAYQNNAEIMRILIERIRAIIGGGPIVVPPGPGKRQVRWLEKETATPVVESNGIQYCPFCGKTLMRIIKPYSGKEEKKAAGRGRVIGTIFGIVVAVLVVIMGGMIGVGILLGIIVGLMFGEMFAVTKVIELRQKNGILIFTKLKCIKCKKQFSRKEE